MRSRISLFDRGLARNMLRRYWPLWAAYFLLLVIMLPVSMYGYKPEGGDMWLSWRILNAATNLVFASFGVSALSALAVFSFMYNSRSCGFVCSLPLRRETVFVTACVMGLAPLLLADVLTFALTVLVLAKEAALVLGSLGQWLGVVAMGNTAFFGMAVFCAMLTGSAPVMPAVYAVLNLAAYVAEGAVRALLNMYIYGFCYDAASFTWLSPIISLGEHLEVGGGPRYSNIDGVMTEIPEPFSVTGMGWLIGYCAVGLVLVGLALLLYRRRRMETAGDVVALSILKPVFKYCMAFGGAVVFACAMNEWVLGGTQAGAKAAATATVMMLAGAFIGYYAADMLMHKSLSVFRGNVKGFAVVCAVLLALAAACEYDVFGYETRVPEAENIDYVQLDFVTGNIREPENIQAFLELHRHIIQDKARNESADHTRWFSANYYLKDGSHFGRIYQLDCTDSALSDPGSDLMLWQAICNSREVTGYRTSFEMPVTLETIGVCNLSSDGYDENGQYRSESVTISAQQTMELYYDCMVPDIADGNLGSYWVAQTEDYYKAKSNTTIYIELVDREGKYRMADDRYEYLDFNVDMASARCLQWIEENTELRPVSKAEAEAALDAEKHILA